MKKLILYSFMSLFLISSCRESDNANVPEFIEVPMPTVKKVSGDPTISVQNPDAFNAKFSVGLYFPDGDKPAKMDVIVRKNQSNTTTKVLKTDITTYPTELSITGAELKALFGVIVLGDKFDLGVDITLANGRKYLAFPTVGVPYGAGVASPAGSSTSTRFEAVCKFTAADYAGNFKVLVDDFNNDFGVGTVIPITVVNDHQLSFVSPVNGAAIIIDVNTATNETKIVKQAYGDYKAAGIDPTFPYGVVSAETVISADNFVAPCDGIISLQIKYTVAAGNFGDYLFKLQKVQ